MARRGIKGNQNVIIESKKSTCEYPQISKAIHACVERDEETKRKFFSIDLVMRETWGEKRPARLEARRKFAINEVLRKMRKAGFFYTYNRSNRRFYL